MILVPQYWVTVWFSAHASSAKGKMSVMVIAGCSLPASASDRPRCSNPIILGDWIPIWNSPGWCYLYGCAAHCVCVAWSLRLHISYQCLPVRVGDHSVGLGPPALRWEGVPKLQPGFSTAAGTTLRVFPLQLITSPYWTVRRVFCILLLQNPRAWYVSLTAWFTGTTIKDTWTKSRGRVEGGGFGWRDREKMQTTVIE